MLPESLNSSIVKKCRTPKNDKDTIQGDPQISEEKATEDTDDAEIPKENNNNITLPQRQDQMNCIQERESGSGMYKESNTNGNLEISQEQPTNDVSSEETLKINKVQKYPFPTTTDTIEKSEVKEVSTATGPLQFLKALNKPSINARIRLPDGTKLKVVGYIPSKKMENKLNDSSLQSAGKSVSRKDNGEKQIMPKYSFNVKSSVLKSDNAKRKWISKDDNKEEDEKARKRRKVYNYRYLNTFKESLDDKKWQVAMREKIYGEKSVEKSEVDKECDDLEVRIESEVK